MQPKSISGKTLMKSSVGLKAPKTSKILSLFHLIFHLISITKELLSKCLSFTEIQITTDDKKILYHSRKLLLFDRGNRWMRKGGDLF